MKKNYLHVFLCFILALAAAGCGEKKPTGPSPTRTITPTNTLNGTVTVTPTITCTPTRTNTATRTPTRTASPTRTPTFTRTGTSTVTPTLTVTATATNTPITIYATGSECGYVRGDGFVVVNPSTSVVGDTSSNAACQTLVSFDISTLTQQVKSAVIYIYQSVTTANPYSTMGDLYIAHVTADYAPLDAADYADPGTISYICAFTTSTAVGWYQLSITSIVESDRLAAKTRSQFRLYFLTLTDNNSTWDTASFHMPAYGGGAYSPRLEVRY
jgi:hypothetical protein